MGFIESFALNGLLGHPYVDGGELDFSYSVDHEGKPLSFKKAELTISNGDQIVSEELGSIRYDGNKLKPYSDYSAKIKLSFEEGEMEKELSFSTGRMKDPWKGRWISDPSYEFDGKDMSPKPMNFLKGFKVGKSVKKALVCMSGLGLYKLNVNGTKAGDRYFAPGFTSYFTTLQYQCYDVLPLLKEGENKIEVNMVGGWAIGSYVFSRKRKWYGDREALLFELRIEYEDGSIETLISDPSWEVNEDGPYTWSDLYDGEGYDANKVGYPHLRKHNKAAVEKLRVSPRIVLEEGGAVKKLAEFTPEFLYEKDGILIYDFKQNFAGVAHLKMNAKQGDMIEVFHAETLDTDGRLNLALLRSAKAKIEYIAKEGEQEYSPEFTYMGFRYIGIKGIKKEDVLLTAYQLSSDIPEIGGFSCSYKLLDRLQKNIEFSARSNFMDIPTDCPQRDERMGWTGDIAIFAETASFLYSMKPFLKKWLRDLRSEQNKGGGFPCTSPVHGYGMPVTMPRIAIDFWGDAILEVPYAIYRHDGDLSILEENYESMKKYVNACNFWAKIWGVGKYRHIWHTPAWLHFGDWVSPDVDKMSTWQKRSKFTATASLAHTSKMLSEIATLLGKHEDAKKYKTMSEKTSDAYCSILMDKEGKLKGPEFQTGYVLPLAFGMIKDEKQKQGAIDNLVALIERNAYRIGTGFPGTPRILEALYEHGHADTAYKMLLNEEAPSWLYGVKCGGTTIFEKFDGMLPDGTARKSTDGTGDMISFNHYASGSVGRFFYERIAGIEMIEPAYKKFKVEPIYNENITSASAYTHSPLGKLGVSWEIKDGKFAIDVDVPLGSEAEVHLPNKEVKALKAGRHHLESSI